MDVNITENIELNHLVSRIFLFTGFFCICENFIAFIIVDRCKRLPLQIKLFLQNLVVVYAIIGAQNFVYSVDEIEKSLGKNSYCLSKHFLLYAVVIICVFLMTFISIDRCLSLLLVMRYQSKVTRLNIISVLVFVWGLGILLSILRTLDTSVNMQEECTSTFRTAVHVTYFVICFVCFATMLSSFFVIFVVLRMRAQSVTTVMKDKEHVLAAQVRAFVKIHFITIFFLLCYIPGILFWTFSDDITSHTILNLPVSKTTDFLYLFNGIITPFLILWRFRECRIQTKLLLPEWCHCCSKIKNDALREKVCLYASYIDSPSSSTVSNNENIYFSCK